MYVVINFSQTLIKPTTLTPKFFKLRQGKNFIHKKVAELEWEYLN